MIVVDEYLAVEAVRGRWPGTLPDDDVLALPATHHYRLLQRLYRPGGGRLSDLLGQLSDAGRDAIRRPHPDVLQVLELRPLLDTAALLAARYGTAGLLVTETLAAGLAHGRALHFGAEENVGRRMVQVADDLGVTITVHTF